MTEIKTSECLVCRKHKGEIDIPGGVIYEDDLIFVSHAQLWGDEKEHYLGHVFVESKRHVAELADLTEQEAQAIGLFTSRIAKARYCIQSLWNIFTRFLLVTVFLMSTSMSLAGILMHLESTGGQK